MTPCTTWACLEGWGDNTQNDEEDIQLKEDPEAAPEPLAEPIPAYARRAADSHKNYPLRGEKQWNAWAADLQDYGHDATHYANNRLPYYSTAQTLPPHSKLI